MRLNIVTRDPINVLNDLRDAFHSDIHGIKVFLANRAGKEIVEYDIICEEGRCISLEAIKEALPDIPDYNIRIRLDK